LAVFLVAFFAAGFLAAAFFAMVRIPPFSGRCYIGRPAAPSPAPLPPWQIGAGAGAPDPSWGPARLRTPHQKNGGERLTPVTWEPGLPLLRGLLRGLLLGAGLRSLLRHVSSSGV